MYWCDAIPKEVKNVGAAFEVWEKSVGKIPVRYQQI
jgi:hypothetical protein